MNLHTFALAVLTTALVTNTWANSPFFSGVRERLRRVTQDEKHDWRIRFIAFGLLCQYCVSHWIGAGVVVLMADGVTNFFVMVAPVIWLANHSIIFYSLLSAVPKYLQARVQLEAGRMRMPAQEE